MELGNCPTNHHSIDYALRHGERAKGQAVSMVDNYMLSADIKLDGTLHPALDTTNPRIKLDTTLHQWIGKELEEDLDLEKFYKDVKIEEQSFRRAIEEYQKSLGPNQKSTINFKETHTMAQVWDVFDSAEQKYRVEDTQGFWGGMRRAFRKLGDHNKAIEGWLGLLPDESE
ncbi:hypothetical protein MMC18_008673 [Xylographa bjoerkii]|nr:hypothetical protein [Xylographa bjoerkii]